MYQLAVIRENEEELHEAQEQYLAWLRENLSQAEVVEYHGRERKLPSVKQYDVILMVDWIPHILYYKKQVIRKDPVLKRMFQKIHSFEKNKYTHRLSQIDSGMKDNVEKYRQMKQLSEYGLMMLQDIRWKESSHI